MKKFQVAYIPIGVPTFHHDSIHDQFHKSIELFNTLTNDVIFPQKPLLSLDDLKDFLDTLDPSLLIVQNIAFANSAYIGEVVKRFECPLLLWTLREPVIDGTRLRLNSLTGAYSAGNLMHHYGKPNFEYIFGSTEDPETRDTLKAMIDATRIREMLKNLNIASIGQTPQGFGFGRGLDAEVLSHFGANLLSIEARELMYKAKTYTEEEYKPLLEEASSKMIGLDSLPKENVENFAKLYKAYKDYIEENNVGAIASRCWPDFFTEYKTPVCAVLGMLNDNLVAASCESDLYGAISMYIGTKLTHLPVYFGDPVSLNEKDSTLTFWHCGTAACSLARPDTGATMGVHPNRKIGPTMEFGCKAEENVTIFRIGRNPNGTFRFFLAKGEAIDAPKQFLGTSIVVQTKTNSKKLVEKSVKDGWEPHFVVIYGDVMQELEMLAHQLEMEVWNY